MIDLTREVMIQVAQLTGSDYCTGVTGIGPKGAAKLIDEFNHLDAFVTWWKMHHKTLTTGADGSKFRLKLKKLKLDPDFPNKYATNAYYHPNVIDNAKPSQGKRAFESCFVFFFNSTQN